MALAAPPRLRDNGRSKLRGGIMHTNHNPPTVAAPFSSYSHGVEVKPNARWLHISGQVGVLPDGRIASGITAQADAAWANIGKILKAAGMEFRDLVKVTTFIRDRADVVATRNARDKHLAGAAPASTLIVVAGLASPDWLIEIEAVAAKP
jgi:2-iminobutanoate/2-iminopropanoate deaminase